MSLSVMDLLTIIENKQIDANASVFSKLSGGFLYCPHPVECACVAIKETEVFSHRIFPTVEDKSQKQKVILIAEAFEDFDYYHCLTVRELLDFLKSVEDKTILVCVSSPHNIVDGDITDVVNAKSAPQKAFYPNEKMRKMFGNNIFHLFIWYI